MPADVQTPQSHIRFSLGRVDITPPNGIYHRMWGAATHDQAAGVHRPLTATIAVFAPRESEGREEEEQILIGLDHCLLGGRELDALLEAIESEAKVDRDSLVVVFSHTHAAGLMSLDRESLPGGELIPEYLSQLNQKIAALVAQTRTQLLDAVISYGTGHSTLAGNRDLWDAERQEWVCGFNPEARADSTVLVARVTDAAGQSLATFVNYACHPTTLAWDNQLVSPDFPGAMREVVERETGVPCFFLQGASGDLGPRDGFVGDVQVADKNGRQLGYAALAALTALPAPATRLAYAGPVVSGATIGTWKHEALSEEQAVAARHWQRHRRPLALNYRPEVPQIADVEAERQRLGCLEQEARQRGEPEVARDLRARGERQTRLLSRLKELPADQYPYDIAVWRMGEAIWVTAQAEPYNLLQTELRRRFSPTPIIVAALSGRWGPSYLPPREHYGKGLYQEKVAVLAPGCLEEVIDVCSERIEKLLSH